MARDIFWIFLELSNYISYHVDAVIITVGDYAQQLNNNIKNNYMNLRYAHLSSGYIGQPIENQSLNPKYYGLFNLDFQRSLGNESTDLIILFPQRIPKSDFFNELLQLETNYYQVKFTEKLQILKQQLKRLAQLVNIEQNRHNIRHYINWANLCLRYGCFKTIIELSPQTLYPSSFKLEIELMKEGANIEMQLSNDLPVNIKNYITLAEQYISKDDVSEREKIMLLNQLVVAHNRHQRNEKNNKLVYKYAKCLLILLEKFEKNTTLNQLYCSIGYRGLSMVSQFGSNMQIDLLKKAESLAMELQGGSISEEIVALDNQYTCFQSLAKWYFQNNELKQAEAYLKKMVEIDPLDSTGHSELGFFYFNNEKYCDASSSFKKAMELGPPGAGMNAYYYANCLEKLGNLQDGITYLIKSTELDNKAVSPWLDLFEIYRNNIDTNNAAVIAEHIIATPDLWEQLDSDEKHYIQNYNN